MFVRRCILAFNLFSFEGLRDLTLFLLPLVVACLEAEALYLMAMVYDKLGRREEREEASALFKKHITAVENPQDAEPNIA